MGLLSGGEKSLTSLAFLFALFRSSRRRSASWTRSTPPWTRSTCVRFLDLMKTIKSDTQFIIITHNYRTMEVADYIYGTTMEEPNVTRVFSMKLEKKAGGRARCLRSSSTSRRADTSPSAGRKGSSMPPLGLL